MTFFNQALGIPTIDKAWGQSLYDASGASSSAREQFKNQLKLQKDAQNFAKWQMGNAHQMEVQDLEDAGLNTVLSAGGGGASASVSQGSASGGSSIIDPISAISGIVGTINSAKQTNSTVENLKNQNDKIKNDIQNQTDKTAAEIAKLKAETAAINYNTKTDKDAGVNGNTPYPIKILKNVRNSARQERTEWKEKAKQPGWNGWKYKARNWIFRQ